LPRPSDRPSQPSDPTVALLPIGHEHAERATVAPDLTHGPAQAEASWFRVVHSEAGDDRGGADGFLRGDLLGQFPGWVAIR